jgi:hypothetical protein
MRSNRHSRLRKQWMHNNRVTSDDRARAAMSDEQRARFDRLRIHVRIRLTEEARKIAQNNKADFAQTLAQHFEFYLSQQS